MPRRRTGRGWLIGGVIAAVAALVCCGGGLTAGVFGWKAVTSSPSAVIREAGAALTEAEALDVRAWVIDAKGRSVAGRFVVTSRNAATGTIDDLGTGRASYVADRGQQGVRGDVTWWGHRRPGGAAGLKDRWINPSTDPFPIDVTLGLSPRSLGAAAERLATDAGESTADDEPSSIGGRRVVPLRSGDWTLYVTADSPRRLLRLIGPLRTGGPILPALARSRATVVPARVEPAATATATAGPPTAAGPGTQLVDDTVPVYEPPYARIDVGRASPAQAAQAASAYARVREQAQAPSATPPSAGARPPTSPAPLTGGPLPPQLAAAPPPPAFDLTLNPRPCLNGPCSWSVSVTNTGGQGGNATVYASAVPGMGTRVFNLGSIPPGGSLSTPPMVFPNPAPPPQPGQRTSVTVSYSAWVYNGPLDGPDPSVPQRLRARGLDPDTIPALQPLDGAYRPAAVAALDAMTRAGTSNTDAAAAITKAAENGLLPAVRDIMNSRRLLNPQDLAKKLEEAGKDTEPYPNQKDFVDQIGYRREVEQAAEILRVDPTARIYLDGNYVDPRDGKTYRADIIDVTNKRAYQIKTTGQTAVPKLKEALRQLNGRNGLSSNGTAENSPPGYKRIAVVFVEPRSEIQFGADRRKVAFKLRLGAIKDELCPPGRPVSADEVIIVNVNGALRWDKAEFDDLGC